MNDRAGKTRFGNFELDAASGTLFREGRRVRIQPQPLRVLAFLVDHAGEVVSRDDLHQEIWDQATFVEFDQGLNYCIRQIRQALGDDASEPTYIETLKKRGYQFIAPVDRISPAPQTEVAASAASPVSPPPPPRVTRRSWWQMAVFPAVVVAVVAAFAARSIGRHEPASRSYTQLTSFRNAAFSPAISPDGRTIAFLVGSDAGFPFLGEIYTKMLPGGEPVQRTHDGMAKYGVAFSADGSQVTYTAANDRWNTETLSVLGGDPHLLISNAAGLTWLDGQHALFSEIKSGLHMGLVTATTSRSNVRDVYVPKHERGMAHYAYASPDRSHVLVVEMGPTGRWDRCRLVPFEGGSAGSQVGPPGACTSAAWSPDGDWMYFSVRVNGTSHLWRQRYPAGEPEQLTFGPLDEDGVIVTPDGRSLLTSAGILESGAWMHDAAGDRVISPEGYAAQLSFSHDGRHLYYLFRRDRWAPNELWVTEVASGKSEVVIEGFPIDSYDVSPDETQVVFAARTQEGVSQIWFTPHAGESQPRLIAAAGEGRPLFGPDGDIVFGASDGVKNYLFEMTSDGSKRRKILDSPILNLIGVSPDGRVALVTMPVNDVPSSAVVAVSMRDASVRRVCPAECVAVWSPDGSRFYVEPYILDTESRKLVSIPVRSGESIPRLPAAGIRSVADAATMHGSAVVESVSDPGYTAFVPGLSKETFAFARTVSHHNLYELTLP